MAAEITREPNNSTVRVTFEFELTGSMLEDELGLQQAANEAMSLASGECLGQFDTDGAPISVGGVNLTSKGQEPKLYQTPYGEVSVGRHVYQSSWGGNIYCPLEHDARVVRTATPLLAKQASLKLTNTNSSAAIKDFAQHGRTMARSYLQRITSDVATIAQEKEQSWSYSVPRAVPGESIRTIAVSVDGTCALFCDEDYRQVMVGTIAFYNGEQERVSTIYVACSPGEGKGVFFERMDRELAHVRQKYPGARYVGIADGAHDHWPWLEGCTVWQVLDFWHASEYLNAVSAAFARGKVGRDAWAEEACRRLKHERGAAQSLLAEMEEARRNQRGKATGKALDKAVSYFGNHHGRMDYATYTAMGLPIGSGVVEAACKSVVKERLCGSGMKWTVGGAQEILDLRAMVKTPDRWEEFWQRISRFGFKKISGSKLP